MKFEVDNFTAGGHLVLWSIDEREVVIAYVTREALADGIPNAGSPTKNELLQLASANINALGRIATAKFEAGEACQSDPGDRPWVVVSLDDILASGEVLSASVLEARFSWVR